MKLADLVFGWHLLVRTVLALLYMRSNGSNHSILSLHITARTPVLKLLKGASKILAEVCGVSN